MKILVNGIQEDVPERYDFLEEWMNVAEGRNLFFRFFCYFLSFNHLYSKDNCLHDDEAEDSHDMPVIVRFMLRAFERARIVDKPCYSFHEDINIETSSLNRHVLVLAEPRLVWIDTEKYIETALANEGLKNGSPEWKIITIFLRIYKIRCNLFHGDKRVTDRDDVRRVEDSCIVLKSFLDWYIDSGLYKPERTSFK